jgi:glycosyltransferase involved in cell wall biosynthesis
MKASVVLSTYNAVEWLEKVLWGFECQTFKEFEVIIADDGSGPATADLIRQFSSTNRLNIKHVWHEDRGFQKSAILNKAIVASSFDYIIFTDGDCIPRKDFVAVHMKHSAPGKFLSGGYFMLPMETSKAIAREDIYSSRCFDVKWLKENGLPGSYKTLKLTSRGLMEKALNFLTPTKPTWNGHNSSGWKTDIVAVNGFNEEMQYGGQDRELGERLVNYGIVGKQIRYSAICVHLDHKRSYKTPESIAKNKQIRKETRDMKKVWTEFGIVKSPKG